MAKNIYEDASLGGAIGTVYGDVRDSAKQWDKLLFDPYRHRLTDAAEAAPQAIANYVGGKAKEGRRQINAFRKAAGYAPLPERAPTAKATPPTPAPQAVAVQAPQAVAPTPSPAPTPQAIAPRAVAPQAVAPQAAPLRGNDVVDYLNQSTGGFSNAGFEPEARGPDLSDLNAIRERVIANGERTGNGASLITLKALNDIASKRWQSYNTARGNDINELLGVGGLGQRNRATDIQQQNAELQQRLRNLPDKEKILADYYKSMATDMSQPPDVREDAGLRFRSLMDTGEDVNASVLEELTARGIMGGGVQMKAEGGEIEPMDMDMMELPGAIDEAPIDMNSGDYVIPVEAMRFYGRKFFQDLINKAEDEEME